VGQPLIDLAKSRTGDRRKGDPPAAQNQRPSGERQEPLAEIAERPTQRKCGADS
jgi:hypothetical protein